MTDRIAWLRAEHEETKTRIEQLRAELDVLYERSSVLFERLIRAGHEPSNEAEIEFLRGDIAAIEELLAELPEHRIIERAGFEARLRAQRTRLAECLALEAL